MKPNDGFKESFTDEDLKRFKDRFSGSMSDPFKVEALIARLEAAEKVVRAVGFMLTQNFEDYSAAQRDVKSDLQEWRKAAGK